MTTEKQYPWWQYNPNMTEKQIRLGNRMHGLFGLTLFGLAAFASPPLSLIVAPIAVDGVGDIITGEHHYLSSRAIHYFSGRRIPLK